jgi:hypothetical protein
MRARILALTVATHRLIDLKRRQTFRVEVHLLIAHRGFFDRRPQPESVPREESLLKLLRAAIRKAFSKRDSESVLMLKLVHLHQLTQREIARMWGWHESKVSRALESHARAYCARHPGGAETGGSVARTPLGRFPRALCGSAECFLGDKDNSQNAQANESKIRTKQRRGRSDLMAPPFVLLLESK